MMKKNSHAMARTKVRPRARGVFRRFASLGRDGPELWIPLEEARRRMWSRPGFFASLTPEEREAIFSYDGPEILGPPDSKYRLK